MNKISLTELISTLKNLILVRMIGKGEVSSYKIPLIAMNYASLERVFNTEQDNVCRV